ncbi:MAG: hypothetical protein OXT63_04430 [Gemmatimonadota bacterium]|nr:hypothetical protein [Gemmatimonadota bacterium]
MPRVGDERQTSGQDAPDHLDEHEAGDDQQGDSQVALAGVPQLIRMIVGAENPVVVMVVVIMTVVVMVAVIVVIVPMIVVVIMPMIVVMPMIVIVPMVMVVPMVMAVIVPMIMIVSVTVSTAAGVHRNHRHPRWLV